MNRPITLAAAFALTALLPAHAQGPPPAPAQDAPKARVDAAPSAAQQDDPTVRRSDAEVKAAFFALQDEFDEAYEGYRAKLTELGKLRRENPNDTSIERPTMPHEAFFPRYLALANEGSMAANLWVVQNHSYAQMTPEAGAVDKRTRILRLLASAPTNEQLTALARALGVDASGRGVLTREEALAFYDLIVASATDPEVQATAAVIKAGALDVRSGSRDERKPAMDAMKAVAERWPDTLSGKRAEGQVFAFENLNIGQNAPNIVGQDVDGNPMALTDFAGRVVVLDFWGFW
jgi:hypothetical protein